MAQEGVAGTTVGKPHIIDISHEEATVRTATAMGSVRMSREAADGLRSLHDRPGDVLAVARIAGIQAAKHTPQLIPLSHHIAIHGVDVEMDIYEESVGIAASVVTADRTGVETEALTVVAVAALAIVDMIKAVDPAAVITDVRIEQSTGGVRGEWKRSEALL